MVGHHCHHHLNCYYWIVVITREPKEASVGAVAKVKQGGKFYSGSIFAVGTKAEIEQQWKELEGGNDSYSATTQDQGMYYYYM